MFLRCDGRSSTLHGTGAIMKLPSIVPIGVLAMCCVQPALAQEGKTRAQVRAELDEARSSGNILAAGEIGLPLNQLHPHRYPAAASAAGKSREQVRAETTEAIRTGDILAQGESGARRNELHPNLYPPVPMAAGKTREQAKAELAEALRTGDILVGGESSLKRNELYPWSYMNATSA